MQRQMDPDAATDRKIDFTPYLLVLLAVMILGLPTLALPLGRDHGIGLYIADVMLQGGAPYRDAWEIRPPGIFYVYGAYIAAFGKTTITLRLGDLLLQTLTALALCRLGLKTYGRAAGIGAGAFYAACYFMGNDFWHMGNTDGAVALPAVLALAALLPHRRGPRLAWDAASGLLIAVAFLVRFTQGLVYVPALALIFAAGARQRPYGLKSRIVRTIATAAGFGLGLGLFVGHMAYKGAWGDFYYTLFVFAPQYASLTYEGRVAEFLGFALALHARFFLDFALVTVPALLAGLWILFKSRTAYGLVALLWLLGAVAGTDIMAKFYGYHWLPIFAPLSFLAGVFLQQVARFRREGRTGWAAAGGVAAVACAVAFCVHFGARQAGRVSDAVKLAGGSMAWEEHLGQFDSLDRGGDFSATANYAAAEYLRSHTGHDDKVFIWGFETLIYFLSDRQAPTRFCSNYPISAVWHRQDWYEELVSTLQSSRPMYILLVTEDEMPWITRHGMDSLTALKREFPELRDFVLEQYEVETTIENIHMCRRKQ